MTSPTDSDVLHITLTDDTDTSTDSDFDLISPTANTTNMNDYTTGTSPGLGVPPCSKKVGFLRGQFFLNKNSFFRKKFSENNLTRKFFLTKIHK